MTGLSSYLAGSFLNYAVAKTNVPAMPANVYLALFVDPGAGTVAGHDNGSGFTEVTGTSYARIQTAAANWNAASTTQTDGPITLTNAATFTYSAAGSNWGNVVAWGLYDAVTSGNLLVWDYLGAYNWLPFSMTSASPGVVTAVGHGYSNSDNVIVTSEYGGSLPTLSQGTFVGTLTTAGVTTDTFTLKTGATALNTSSTGDGMVRKIISQAINTGVVASFSAGTLTLSAA